jgi:hypothetical protein
MAYLVRDARSRSPYWYGVYLVVSAVGLELQKKIVDGVLEEVDGRSFEELSQERDTLIMGLLELLSHRSKTKPVAASGHTFDDS